MDEIFQQAIAFLRGMWRYRRQALIAAWVVALIGWGVVIAMPPTYEARTRIYVDAETVLKPLLTGLAIGADVVSQAKNMSSVLLTRPNLEKVARETELDLTVKDAKQREALIGSLQRRIQVQGSPDNIFTISFRDGDPERSARVVQNLLKTFLADTLRYKESDTTNAQRFLETQLHDLEGRLRDSENRLAEFKKRSVGLMPGERGDYYTRMQAGMAALEDLRSKTRQAEDRRAELMRQLEGEEPTFGLVGTRSSDPYEARIAGLQAQIDALLVQYTEKHPKVVALQEQIDHIRDLKSKKAPLEGTGTGSTIAEARTSLRSLDINPVYQSMKLALSQTEVELADLRSQTAQKAGEVRELQSKVNTIPEVEAQLASLNRDYEVNKAQYNALLQRLESARLSEEAERSNRDVKFRIVEPPVVPVAPVSPNRPLLLTAVLLIALAASAVVGFLLQQMNPVFSTRSELQKATGRAVLGAITLASDVTQTIMRRRAWVYGGAYTLLIVTYVATVMFSSTLASVAGLRS
jgi:polysaccharide chain length determinant protein (PEP-CTERM system associated)